MEKVYVVSVRRGFQQVALGRWGNGGNTFGGFTDSPEEYQIRRMTVYTGGGDTPLPAGEKASWEVIERLTPRQAVAYPSADKVPRNIGMAVIDGEANVVTPIAEMAAEIPAHHYRYYKEIPPTWYVSRDAVHPLFSVDEANDKLSMTITNLTGWRYFDEVDKIFFENGQQVIKQVSRVSYHRGLDVIPANGATGDILAPADGKFWFLYNATASQIRLPNGEVLGSLYQAVGGANYKEYYSDQTYGVITVLVTEPERLNDPEDRGRVYLFCHQGPTTVSDEGNTAGELRQHMENLFLTKYPLEPMPFITDSDSGEVQIQKIKELAMIVNAGEWIGQMSNRGASKKPGQEIHVHLEVYEWFPAEKIERNAKDKPEAQAGEWQRVNPKTPFPAAWMSEAPDADSTQDLMLELDEKERADYFQPYRGF